MFSFRNSDTVTLRRPPQVGPSKGVRSPSFEARRKCGEHLRMTILIGLVLAASASIALAAGAGHYGYGKPASQAEIAGWDIDVRGDDGVGLPPGKGSAAGGAELYAN